MDQRTPQEKLLGRKAALWAERSSWISHWRDISTYQQPRAGRFVATDRNRGDKRANSINDNSAMQAQRILSAGLMSGMTSPARPWFKLEIHDRDLMEEPSVKGWLYDVGTLLRAIFSQSNTYRALHSMYDELGLFGTAAGLVLPNFDHVIHHYTSTVGEYALAVNAEGHVDTFCREIDMTVAQVVEDFGLENCSPQVKNLWDRSSYDEWVRVVHMVQPRRDRDYSRKDRKNKPWASCYIEPGRDAWDKYLRESGFDRFPVVAPRWIVVGNDTYGHSPGMECNGDVMQLQHQQRRKAQAIDYQVNPPLQVPTRYKEVPNARLPGGLMYVDQNGPGQAIRTAYEVSLNVQHLLADNMDVRERIKAAYYADLFLMLANDTRSGITATEVAERHEEKLLMLGPVLERLHNELLDPLIDITFDYANEAGILPKPPPELEGMDLQVQFISVLAQAQRMVAAQGSDRLLQTTGMIAQMNPEVLDKINFDQAIDDYAEMYGVNPELIVPDREVAQKRDARKKQMEAQQAAASMPAMAQTAKTTSEIDGDNMRDVMSGLMGYSSAGGP